MKQIIRLLLLCVFALIGSGARTVEAAAPYGWIRTDGRPVAWNNSQPISYSVDQGPLGRLANADAVSLVQTAFQHWQGVPAASISFTAAAPLSQDITGANVLAFLNNLPAGVNPVIFDTDGSVTRALLGDPGAAIAFGRPLTVDPTGSTITRGLVVLNGLYLDGRFNPDDLSLADYRGVVVQEIGRFLGLGYSQLNTDLILDGNPSNNNLITQMYPQPVPGNGDQLTTDDRASLAALYPNPTAAAGTIRGQVLLPDGTTGLQGINVIARLVGDPQNTAVSAISGMRFKNEIGPPGLDGSRQTALRGEYELTGLPPGSYTLTFEALRPDSQAGPLRHPAFLPGGTQYYRAGGSATTDPNAATPIAVSAGQVVDNVNLVVAAPAGPPIQDINEQEPNEFPEEAQSLPASARVHGSVQPGDASGVTVTSASGAGVPVQDLYGLTLSQPAIVTATLSAVSPGANLNLFLLTGPVATSPTVVAASTDPGTPPQTFQLRLPAGVYYLGVSLSSGVGTAYTLEVNSTAAPDPTTAAPPRPRLTNLIVGNVTTTGADTDFASDLPSNTILYLTNPLTEFSSPTLVTDHRLSLSGLTQGTPYRLRTLAVTAVQGIGTLPDAFFTAAMPTLVGGAGQIAAGVVDVIDDPNDPNAEYEVISFRNVGTGDATGVALTSLNAPAGWTFTVTPPLPLNLGLIGRGGSGLLLTRIQTAGGTAGVASRAHIAARAAPLITGTGTYNSGTGQQSFTIGGVLPSLTLAKSVNPATASPGGTVTFTLTATNTGMGAASGVVIADTLAAGVSFVAASGGGQIQNGVVTWNVGVLPPGGTATVTLQAQVAPNAANGTTITNVAQIHGNETPTPISSNSVPVSVNAPPPAPQLQLTKSADRTTARPGDPINYTLTFLNAGTGAASNVLLTDVLPPGTILVSAPGGVLTTVNGANAVVWAIGPLPAGASSSRSLQLQVAPNTLGGATITNTAQITATEVSTSVTASAPPVQVAAAPPQLTLVKTADHSSANPGDLITYTLTLTNAGSGAATNVRVSDSVPAGTLFAGFGDSFSTNTGALQSGTIIWNIGTVAANGTATVSFRAQVLSPSQGGSPAPINNTAQVTSTEVQTPVPSNPVSTNIIALPPPPQLQIQKQLIGPATVAPGGLISYQLTYSNAAGAGPATSVTLQDVLPANTTFAGATGGAGAAGNAVIWNIGPLQPGQSGSVTLQVQAATGLPNGTPITNMAQITSAEIQSPVPSNPATVTVLAAPPPPALSIIKQADVTTAPPGGTVNFRLTIANNGGGPASNVTVTDPIPAGMTGVLALDGGFITPGSFGGPATATWNLGSLGPGQSTQVRLQVQVNSGATGTITNVAQATSTETPSPVSSNGASVTVQAPPPPLNLVIQKVLSPAAPTAAPGDTLRYVISFQNNGAGTVTGAAITDVVPANTQFLLGSQNVTPSGGVLTWPLPAIAPGQGGSVAFQVMVSPGTPNQTLITNQAQITVAAQQYAQSSNIVSTTVVVAPPPLNLTVQKAVDRPSASPGDVLTYTIGFKNNGGPVSGAVITDAVPQGTQFVDAVPAVSPVNGVLSWNLPVLSPGQTGSVSFRARVNPALQNVPEIDNQAQIAVPAQQYAQNSNTAVTTIIPAGGGTITLQKSVDKPNAASGDTLTYTLGYANNTTHPLNAVTIVDPLPAGVTFLGSPSGGQVSGGTVQFAIGGVPAGTGGSVSFQVTVNAGVPGGTVITNQAQLGALGLSQPVQSNPVSTTVSASAATSFAGTWLALPANDNAVSLTVDSGNHFTVWSISKDRQTIAHSGQGKLGANGSFDILSGDRRVHFTGQVAADGQSARITVARMGFVPYTITAPRAPDVASLANSPLVGTFNGTGTAANGDRLQVVFSVDPGGNCTFQGTALQASTSSLLLQFAHFYVTADGTMIDPQSNRAVGTIQNNGTSLTYNFVVGNYQNTFQVPLQPLTP